MKVQVVVNEISSQDLSNIFDILDSGDIYWIKKVEAVEDSVNVEYYTDYGNSDNTEIKKVNEDDIKINTQKYLNSNLWDMEFGFSLDWVAVADIFQLIIFGKIIYSIDEDNPSVDKLDIIYGHESVIDF